MDKIQKIKNDFIEEIEAAAKELLQEEWFQELDSDSKEAQGCEYFVNWEIYYSETERRGDSGDVIDAMQEIIEDATGFQWELPKDTTSREFATLLVNVAAEIAGPTFI